MSEKDRFCFVSNEFLVLDWVTRYIQQTSDQLQTFSVVKHYFDFTIILFLFQVLFKHIHSKFIIAEVFNVNIRKIRIEAHCAGVVFNILAFPIIQEKLKESQYHIAPWCTDTSNVSKGVLHSNSQSLGKTLILHPQDLLQFEAIPNPKVCHLSLINKCIILRLGKKKHSHCQ